MPTDPITTRDLPTTTEVRASWSAYRDEQARFDRWLASVRAEAREQALREAREAITGWIVVDKSTRALDWDGELHPSEEAARMSLDGDRKYNDPDWNPLELYEVLPVLSVDSLLTGRDEG